MMQNSSAELALGQKFSNTYPNYEFLCTIDHYITQIMLQPPNFIGQLATRISLKLRTYYNRESLMVCKWAGLEYEKHVPIHVFSIIKKLLM